MKAHIRHIGIVDQSNSVHAVSFTPGVNVITGKSSTGKSAIIEIFDYCFGGSDFTVPEGVITKSSALYFVVIRIKESNLVLGRRRDSDLAFIKEEENDGAVADQRTFKIQYFSPAYFIPLADFKKELGRYFALGVYDTDTNVEERKYKGSKSPAPSVRSFTSFMLQHQNLIANKHAIFYRFDEKEKREQVIEHFKVFTGFADQTYFLRAQELNALKRELRQVELQIPKAVEAKRKAHQDLLEAVHQYSAISGNAPVIEDIDAAIQNPMRALDRVKRTHVSSFPLSDENARQRRDHEREKAKLVAQLRKRQHKLLAIKSSIDTVTQYTEQVEAVAVPSHAGLSVSQCPFCKNEHHLLEDESNKLQDAISWLNEELERSPYLLESFEADEQQVRNQMEEDKQAITAIDERIAVLETQISDLANYNSQAELALKAKWNVEAQLEKLANGGDKLLNDKRTSLKERIQSLSSVLRDHYNVEGKLSEAEETLRALMADIGNRFEFENSYRPIKLKFSLETFDLWHEAGDRKVFLRSMGSGANWLYCHLTLFLALHRYFCELGERCKIPPILFLDQPSQVYFPSVIDNESTFDPDKLATLEGDSRTRPVDEDIRAVTNLYSQLVRFCKETLVATGIEPQIIVSDHADNLELEGGSSFESLVKGRRWRTHGFINTEGEVV